MDAWGNTIKYNIWKEEIQLNIGVDEKITKRHLS